MSSFLELWYKGMNFHTFLFSFLQIEGKHKIIFTYVIDRAFY